ncbi:hypothetical protein PLICRDRAFT_40319 [Plicaturopsis crispa FD-325 SS-3]|nr:hypothetical protein PLICRDRAFT_40319 [Plicaturopsis crispa FD-325 SS-3]
MSPPPRSTPAMAPALGPHDELTTMAYEAVQALPPAHKANLLLQTSFQLISAGQYGDDVEKFLEVYLRTPGLTKQEMAKALLARGNARKAAGDKLLVKAKQDFQAVLNLDPSNHELQTQFQRRDKLIHFMSEPASQRAPPEIWERIAYHIPRYHLRTWLFVSAFHRDIASRIIFRTLDLYFGEDQDNLNRGLDIFDRVKSDPQFACRIKTLRLHWSYEESDMLDLVSRIFRSTIPEFKSLREFEWIGYPEMRKDMVRAVLASHPHLHSLGLIGWHFDAVGVSAFKSLRKFTLRAEDDDGFADMGEVRTVLDQNEHTLQHLCLGAYLARHHSWDSAFQSLTIKNLTHLDLVDTRISHIVLARIAHAHNLQSLTLHGTFEQPSAASVVFGSDHVLDGRHTFLPHLEAFRFVLVGHDDELGLFQSVAQFLRCRRKLRRLDLGNCPWELVASILPDLTSLRVLRVRFANMTQDILRTLIQSIPKSMVAMHVSAVTAEKPLHESAPLFSVFHSLAFLHLHGASRRRPQPNLMSEKDFQLQTDLWMANLRNVACVVPTLDFVGWHGEHYAIVRSGGPSSTEMAVELKELPSRRRLDCGKGVDLGSEDASWLERKDVPMDYEMSGLDM